MNNDDKNKLFDLLVTWDGAAIVVPRAEDVIQERASIKSIIYVLKLALRDIENEKPLTGHLKEYIVSSFKSIIGGTDPDHAFKIKHGSRRKTDGAYERFVTLVVYLAIEKDGLSTVEAIEQTATNYRKSSETIKTIYYRRKKEVESMIQWVINNELGKKDP